jgi:Pvc16 N-terminal domain/Carboxypeptidase regulatory-like domain
MIDLLSQTLSELLKPALDQTPILFDQPSETFKPERTSLNLFLYDIRENLELRSNEPRIEPRAAGKVAIQRPPFRIACSYLITAWAVDGPEPPLQEQRLLAQVLAVLLRYPTIPAALLRGGLKGQEPPLPLLVAQADGLKAPHEFWTAIGNKLRPSITATVTIGMEVAEPKPEEATLVHLHDIVLGERTSPAERRLKPAARSEGFRIAGRVMDAEEKPIADAIVSVLGTGLKTETDAQGRYTLGLLAPGQYTLQVQKADREGTLQVTIPGSDARDGSRLDLRL